MMFAIQIEKLIKKKIQSHNVFSCYLRPLKFSAASAKTRAHTLIKTGTELDSNTCMKHDTELQEKNGKNTEKSILTFHS